VGNVLGILLALGWVVAFCSPLLVMYASLAYAPRWVAAWTGWPGWLSVLTSVAAGLVVSAAFMVLAWPKLLGYPGPRWPRRARAEPIDAPAREPAAPAGPPLGVLQTDAPTPVASDVASDPEPAPAVTKPAVFTDDQIRAIHGEAQSLSDAGDHDAAIARIKPLAVEDVGRLGNPHLGCIWERLERSADRATDRSAARFAYALMVEHATWELSNATASGEARSAQENIRRLQAKH
jgi:hypothetical protein